MINLQCRRRDFPFGGYNEIIVIALGHRRPFLRCARHRQPHLRPQRRRDPLPDEPLESNGVGEHRQPQRGHANPLPVPRDLRLQVPIRPLARLKSPPHPPLLPHPLPHLVQHIGIVHIALDAEPIEVLELDSQSCGLSWADGGGIGAAYGVGVGVRWIAPVVSLRQENVGEFPVSLWSEHSQRPSNRINGKMVSCVHGRVKGGIFIIKMGFFFFFFWGKWVKGYPFQG